MAFYYLKWDLSWKKNMPINFQFLYTCSFFLWKFFILTFIVSECQQHVFSTESPTAFNFKNKIFLEIKTYGKHIQYMYIYTCSWVLILSLCLVVFDYLPCTRRSQILCARGQGEIPLGATWWNNRNRIYAKKNPVYISFLAVYIHTFGSSFAIPMNHRYCKTWSKSNFYW